MSQGDKEGVPVWNISHLIFYFREFPQKRNNNKKAPPRAKILNFFTFPALSAVSFQRLEECEQNWKKAESVERKAKKMSKQATLTSFFHARKATSDGADLHAIKKRKVELQDDLRKNVSQNAILCS